MSAAKRWTVDISIGEVDGNTSAEARLHAGDDAYLAGTGHANYAHAWNIAHARRFTVQPEVKAAADAQGQAA